MQKKKKKEKRKKIILLFLDKESNDQKLASANTTFSLKLVVDNDDLTANAFSQTTMIHKCALIRIKKISENRDL